MELNLDESKNFAVNLAGEILQKLTRAGVDTLFLLLEGEMGSGKTTFTREFGKALGIESKITSPTFIGVNEYRFIHKEQWINFFHLDLYQVNFGAENFTELLERPGAKIFVIEWSEKLKPELLEWLKRQESVKSMSIKFTLINDKLRKIHLNR